MRRPSTVVLYRATDISISPKNSVKSILYGVPRALARGGASVCIVSKVSPDWTSMSSFLAYKTLPYLVISLIRSLHSSESFLTLTLMQLLPFPTTIIPQQL